MIKHLLLISYMRHMHEFEGCIRIVEFYVLCYTSPQLLQSACGVFVINWSGELHSVVCM